MSKIKYDLRGVSSDKQDVHNAIRHLDKGLYPSAFCKILPDILSADKDFCNIMHADTAGTKTALAYLYWRETGDVNVWKGIVQDALVMNIDDMACVGCVNDFIISSTIGRNKHLIPASIIDAIISGLQEFIDEMAKYEIRFHSAGGETADVGDIVRTIDIGYTVFARIKRNDLIINNIQPKQIVVGLASYGQAIYEKEFNSGIGSNGLTSARHDVLDKSYMSQFPETYAPQIPSEFVYSGTKKLSDKVNYDGNEYEVGKLLLSPTRTFLPIMKAILQEKLDIRGIIHATGGGQTKVKKFIKNVHIIKDNLLPVPPVFRLIADESHTNWREMYQVFNMGTRLEIYTHSLAHAEQIIQIANSFGVPAQIIGYTEACEGEKITVKTTDGIFEY